MHIVIDSFPVLIDQEDHSLLLSDRWRVGEFANGCLYVYRTTNAKAGRFLHRVLMNAPRGQEVDHRNGDGLDNRRSNLRLASHSMNMANARKHQFAQGTSSQFKGVYWHKGNRMWMAYITSEGKRRTLGYFHDEIEAARTYDAAAIEAFGEFARPNFSIAHQSV